MRKAKRKIIFLISFLIFVFAFVGQTVAQETLSPTPTPLPVEPGETPTQPPLPTPTPTPIEPGENKPPVALINYSPEKPVAGGEIYFDASASYDVNNDFLTYKWDFDNDGGWDSSQQKPTYVYSQPGTYTVKLVVFDGQADSEPAYTILTVNKIEVLVWTGGEGTDGHLIPEVEGWWEGVTGILAIHVRVFAGEEPLEGATVFFRGIVRGETDGSGYLRFLFSISGIAPIPTGKVIDTVEARWKGVLVESEPTLIYESEGQSESKRLTADEISVYRWELMKQYYERFEVPLPYPLDIIQTLAGFLAYWVSEEGFRAQVGDVVRVETYKFTAPGVAPVWLVAERVMRDGEIIIGRKSWTEDEMKYLRATTPRYEGLLAREGISMTLLSPATLYVTAPDGSHAGYEPLTGELKLDFPIVISDPGDEPFRLFIPQPEIGEYRLRVVGTGDGSYNLAVQLLDENGSGGEMSSFTAFIKKDEVDNYRLFVSESGSVNVLPILLATIRIEPEILNLASQGELTVFIQLPKDYNAAEIDVGSVLCEGIPTVKEMVSKIGETYIVKFKRQDLVNVAAGEAVTLKVSGKVRVNEDLIDFEGSDTVRIKN